MRESKAVETKSYVFLVKDNSTNWTWRGFCALFYRLSMLHSVHLTQQQPYYDTLVDERCWYEGPHILHRIMAASVPEHVVQISFLFFQKESHRQMEM